MKDLPTGRDLDHSKGDYFFKNRPLQPKREVAEYVGANGILVPEQFPDLMSAIRSNKPFVVRSEHPQDFAGASGVLDSLFVSPSDIGLCSSVFLGENLDWETFFRKRNINDKPDLTGPIIARIMRGQEELEKNLTNLSFNERRRYCMFTGLSEEEFDSEISYSYWESIPGINRTVVADSAIKDRYHIFSTIHDLVMGFPFTSSANHLVYENGKMIAGQVQDVPENNEANLHSLIEGYEAVRNLDRFPADNCLITEWQSHNNRNYFLQAHLGTTFTGATFKLDREPEADELQAVFVRGATPPEGLVANVAIYFAGIEPDRFDRDVFQYTHDPMFIEAFIRKRRLEVSTTPTASFFFHLDRGHLPRSLLMKPQISAVFVYSKFADFRGDIKYNPEDPIPYMPVRLISDGEKGYMQRMPKIQFHPITPSSEIS